MKLAIALDQEPEQKEKKKKEKKEKMWFFSIIIHRDNVILR